MKTKAPKKYTNSQLIEHFTKQMFDEDLDLNDHLDLFLVMFERFQKYAPQSKIGLTKEHLLNFLDSYSEKSERLAAHNAINWLLAELEINNPFNPNP